MSHGAGGCYYGALAARTRASIVCSLSGRDYDAGLARFSRSAARNGDSDRREIDTDDRNEPRAVASDA